MLEFTLTQAAEWVGGTASGDAVLCTVSTDSREIPQGCLFIPLKGERFDAHDFIEQVIASGVTAVMSAKDLPNCPVPVLRVQDTGKALLALAGGYRAQFDCPVVAITGSVGKTTTKGMVASVLSQRYNTLKTKGNRNNLIGMPLTALEMDLDTDTAVIEMGMSEFGEISAMTECAQPNIAVITNIGTSHIEFLGSREGICRAKMEILEGLAARRGIAVLNGDEPLLWEKKEEITARCVWFGIENKACDIVAENIRSTPANVTFTLCMDDARTEITIPLAGVHNVPNALVAAACGWLLELDGDDVAAGIANFVPEGSRQLLYTKNGLTIYEDCYNASPDSVEASCRVLAQQPCQKRHAVLGSMLELGDYTAEGHRRAGRAAAQACDKLWLYGAECEFMRQGAMECGMKAEDIVLLDTQEALAQALRACVQTGDGLLFKGSHSMHMERVLTLLLGEEK